MFELYDRVRVANYVGGADIVGLTGKVVRLGPVYLEVDLDNHAPMLFKESELDKVDN